MIYLTGDIHGPIDIHKMSSENWEIGKSLTKEDYLICLGDFGLLWDNSKEEVYWRNWLGEKPWTTVTLWGNHENFSMISKLGQETMFGAPVDLIRTSGGYMYGLKNGYIYTINDKTFFVMGGATSIDKQYRKEGVSWWAQEIPSEEDWERAYAELNRVNWRVDYILTHTCPSTMVRQIAGTVFDLKIMDPVALKLEDLRDEFFKRGEFKRWYFGHMHTDGWIPHHMNGDKKFFALYRTVMELF